MSKSGNIRLNKLKPEHFEDLYASLADTVREAFTNCRQWNGTCVCQDKALYPCLKGLRLRDVSKEKH